MSNSVVWVDIPVENLDRAITGRLDQAEAAVKPAGGKILEPKHAIGPHGFRVVALDSEGNRVALHSF